MFRILTQDRRKLVSIEGKNISLHTHSIGTKERHYIVCGRDDSHFGDLIGSYCSEERCRQVLEDICRKMEFSQLEDDHTLYLNYVYRMPEK